MGLQIPYTFVTAVRAFYFCIKIPVSTAHIVLLPICRKYQSGLVVVWLVFLGAYQTVLRNPGASVPLPLLDLTLFSFTQSTRFLLFRFFSGFASSYKLAVEENERLLCRQCFDMCIKVALIGFRVKRSIYIIFRSCGGNVA